MAVFIALVIKTPNADEDDDMEEDEEDFELASDEEWLHGRSGKINLTVSANCGTLKCSFVRANINLKNNF